MRLDAQIGVFRPVFGPFEAAATVVKSGWQVVESGKRVVESGQEVVESGRPTLGA
jgi:hypothetical protein